jgi:hypothetical protein
MECDNTVISKRNNTEIEKTSRNGLVSRLTDINLLFTLGRRLSVAIMYSLKVHCQEQSHTNMRTFSTPLLSSMMMIR